MKLKNVSIEEIWEEGLSAFFSGKLRLFMPLCLHCECALSVVSMENRMKYIKESNYGER